MRDTREAYRGVGRLLLGLAVTGMYAPVAMVFLYSFNASRVGSVWTGFSARWYWELLGQRDLWDGLRASLQVGLVASTASVAMGTLAAMGLRRWRARPRRLAHGLLVLPLVVPDMIIAVSLAIFFHAIGARMGFLTIALAHVSFGLSYAFVIVSAAATDLDEAILAAALDCGATPSRAFWTVTMPILAPSLIIAWLLTFALSFDDFLITFFTKGPGTDTLPIKIYSRMRFGVRPDTNALFVVLFLATLSCLILAGWAGRHRDLPKID
jgi:ABC-type spermidine/putrescine transport system permease subunit II